MRGARAVVAVALAAWAAAAARAQTWTELGPAPLAWFGVESSGRVSAVACSPTDPGRYFVAGADGGVWRTTDGGLTWTPLTDHMPTTAIGALALDPTDENVIYAGTGEANFANHSRPGVGIYKSVDGGETWAHLAEGVFAGRCVSRIMVDPQHPGRVYAAVTRAGGFPEMAAAKGHPGRNGPLGVFRSEDGGETWTRAPGLPDLSCTDLAMDPGDPAVLYAAVGHIFGSPENGIYKSVDGGETWARLGGGLPASVGRISVGTAPGMPGRVYALLTRPADPSGGGANSIGGYRSDDGGATWRPFGNVHQASYGWYLSAVSVNPADPGMVFYAGLDLARVSGSGSGLNVTPPHVDVHALAWDAAGRLVCGNDGGVHRSENLGSSWVALNDGLGLVQFYAGLSTHPADPMYMIGGTQDNGTNRRTTDTLAWTNVFGGDGGWTQLDRARPHRVFAESQGTGNIGRSLNGGSSFQHIGGGLSGRNCFLPPYVIDPVNPDRMLYGTHRVFESLVGGGSWAAISEDLSDGAGAIRALAIAPSDPSVVYAATNDGNMQRSDDGGRTFTLIRDDNPGWPRVTREICVDPRDAMTVYLAVGEYGTEQVLRSTDGGASWEALDAGLPDIPVNVVALDVRGALPAIYAGTDAGLYRSADGGATWRRYGEGLPNACVIDVLVEPEHGRVLVGTQGRGAWWAPIVCEGDFDADGTLSLADFVAFRDAFVAGDSAADRDGDGALTLRDFVAFRNAYVRGCP